MAHISTGRGTYLSNMGNVDMAELKNAISTLQTLVLENKYDL